MSLRLKNNSYRKNLHISKILRAKEKKIEKKTNKNI